MNKKKIVVFHINNQNQFFGEFHENAKLWMVKSFFKDISHINQFKFLYNGEWCLHDEITLRELTKGGPNYEILLIVYPYDDIGNEKLQAEEFQKQHKEKLTVKRDKSISKLNNQINEDLIAENNSLKLKNISLEQLIKSMAEENQDLQLIIIDCNNNLSHLQNSLENLQISNNNLIKQLDKLKREKQDFEMQHENLKTKFENYRASVIKRNTTFLPAGISTQRINTTGSKKKSVSLTKTNHKSKTSRVENLATPLNKMSNTEENYTPSRKSSISSSKKKTNSLLFSRKSNRDSYDNLQLSSSSIKSVIFFEGKKFKTLVDDPSNEVIQNAPKQMRFSKSMTNISKGRILSIDSAKSLEKSTTAPDYKWSQILSYLHKEDQYNLSQTTIDFFGKVMDYWLDLTKGKIENINYVRNDNKRKYETLLAEDKFQFTAATNSALKVLNQTRFGDVFKKDFLYFEENHLSPYYKLFFQLSKTFKFDLKEINSKEFVLKFKEYFLNNSGGNGIGELCKSLSEKFDFSEENVEKVFHLMQNYRIKTIDTLKIGKVCRTTGIISFLIKDALVFCGLDTNDKKNCNTQNFSEKKSIIEQNIDFKEMLDLSKKYMERLRKAKSKLHT